jgi:hypothetical protein
MAKGQARKYLCELKETLAGWGQSIVGYIIYVKKYCSKICLQLRYTGRIDFAPAVIDQSRPVRRISIA